jgi:hypothetical protein
MQTDEDVGKMSQATPVLISKALELFMQSLIEASCQETRKRQSKRLTPIHLKQCIINTQHFDFLKSVVAQIPDPTSEVEENNAGSSSSSTGQQRKSRGRPSNTSLNQKPGMSVFSINESSSSSSSGVKRENSDTENDTNHSRKSRKFTKNNQ